MSETTTAPERWLQSIPESQIREAMRGLWRVESSGGPWLVVTDGWSMLAEPTARDGLKPWDGPNISGWLSERGKSLGERPASAVLEWAGAPVLHERCSNCSGTGESVHTCDCELCTTEVEPCPACEGTLVLPAEPRLGTIAGMLIDRNKLALILAAIGDATITLYKEPDRKHHRLAGTYPGGLFLLMEMRPEAFAREGAVPALESAA